ncbi:MAG: flavodoxin family protein [Bulleidia sp.]
MNTVIIHGQNHHGSTYLVSRKLAEKTGGTIREFFLPKDFHEPCTGCFTCYHQGMEHCPHHASLKPVTEALLWADLIILDSPVYVFHPSGSMMNLLDHYAMWWMLHRPQPEMSHKQAVAVATAAGSGMKKTVNDMADSLTMWGIAKVYRLPLAVQASRPDEIPEKVMKEIERKTDILAEKINRNVGIHGCHFRAKALFSVMRHFMKNSQEDTCDLRWWRSHDWFGKQRPWK